ncbi:MAG: SUMF1/EgtB/PvdO family nonheme iron enzyme [Verrucomicrobiota bacterium]
MGKGGPMAETVEVDGGALPATSEVKEKRVGRFWVGKYEVTWREWQAVREWAVKKGYEVEEGGEKGLEHPVTNVNWYSAVKWCNARSEKEGLTAVYEEGGAVYRSGKSVPTVKAGANGYRLPSDGEWEWAARGGVKGKGYEYSGSNDAKAVAWTYQNSGGGAHMVGTKLGNELGIFDMSGNVWEWCFDEIFGPYRVMRGGGWDADVPNGGSDSARVSYRNSGAPSHGNTHGGFRVARSSVP